MSLCEPPINEILGALLLLVAAFSAVRGMRRVRGGLARAVPLELVRGIRGCVVAVALGVLAAGLLSGRTGFLVFGAIFLGEELYETGVLALVIRSGSRRADTGIAQ